MKIATNEDLELEDTKDADDDLLKDYPIDNYDNDNFSDLGNDFFGSDRTAPMEKHSDLLKQLCNFTPYLREKINGWLGLVWDENKEKYIQNPYVQPIMNEKCASWCIDYLKTYARNNNIITDIGREEYNNMIGDVIDVVWLNLGTRAEEFELRNNGDILKIAVELEHATELVLMGAGDGKYSKLLSTTTSRSENLNLNPNQQQQMGMGMMPPYQQTQQPKVGMFGKIKKVFGG